MACGFLPSPRLLEVRLFSLPLCSAFPLTFWRHRYIAGYSPFCGPFYGSLYGLGQLASGLIGVDSKDVKINGTPVAAMSCT